MSNVSKFFATWLWKFPGLGVLYSGICYLVTIFLVAVFSDSVEEVSHLGMLGFSILLGGLISYSKFRGEFTQLKKSLRPGDSVADAWKKEISPFVASARKALDNTKHAAGSLGTFLRYCIRLMSLTINGAATLYKKIVIFLGRKKAAERAEADRKKAAERAEALLEEIKVEVSSLDTEIKASETDFLNICKENYLRIVNRVQQEQNDLSALSERHQVIGKFLVTRGTDDLSSDVFLDLKSRLDS